MSTLRCNEKVRVTALKACVIAGFVMLFTSRSVAQEISPLNPGQLSPGFHVDAYGCVVGPHSDASPRMLATDDARVLRDYQQYPRALAHYRSQYAEFQHDLLNAVALRRRELRSSPADESQKDAEIRLPLSIDLARLGSLMAARHIWLGILTRRDAPLDPAFSDLQHRRYDVGLQKLSIDTTTLNIVFQDSVASAHLQRGINYASHRDFERATAEWRLAVRCSPDFEWAHFLLGAAAQLRAAPVDARSEWLLTLESSEPAPPDHPRSIDDLKYEAMSLLVKPYTL